MSKIVIIEDDALIAKIYENKLRAEGHQVAVETTGASGIETVKKTRPDLVLVDLMLPDVSGAEVIKRLRKERLFANLPIIAYSGADADILDKASGANATIVLSKKDLSPREIFEQIRAVLKANRIWQTVEPNPLGTAADVPAGDADKPRQWERVLLVEDDPIITTIVKNVIENAGYQAVTSADGAEAYRILTEDANFAAAIFDIEIPKIKGLDLIRYMRSEKRLQRIPVMAMTGEDSIRIQIDSHSAGASLFIPKPFERATLESLFLVLVGNKNGAKA